MTSCIFTKTGLKTVKQEVRTSCKHPIIHLNHLCEIDEGVTVKDIMKVVAKDKLLSLVVSCYSDVSDIEMFHHELNKKGEREKSFHYIEVYKSGDFFGGEINIYSDWHGVDSKKTCKYCGHKKWPDHGHFFALDFIPLNEIANIEVKLNKRLIVRESYKKIALDVKCSFTLLDILHAIYYDISFYGGPSKRDVLLKQVKEGKWQ